MPMDYCYNPQKLSKNMNILLKEELVIPVIPGQYIYSSETFFEGFRKLIENNPIIKRRRGTINSIGSILKQNKFQIPQLHMLHLRNDNWQVNKAVYHNA